MARYNEVLVGRFARSVQKLFGIKGEVPVASLAGEIVVGHAYQSGAENRYLEGWQRFILNQVIPAGGAGNVSVARFRNPVGSNVICVMERVTAGNISGVADQPVFSFQIANAVELATISTATPFDPRGQQASTAIASFKNNSATVFGTTQYILPFPANQSSDLIITDVQEFPVLPIANFNAFDVRSNTANVGLVVGYMWRERFLEDSERT